MEICSAIDSNIVAHKFADITSRYDCGRKDIVFLYSRGSFKARRFQGNLLRLTSLDSSIDILIARESSVSFVPIVAFHSTVRIFIVLFRRRNEKWKSRIV